MDDKNLKKKRVNVFFLEEVLSRIIHTSWVIFVINDKILTNYR